MSAVLLEAVATDEVHNRTSFRINPKDIHAMQVAEYPVTLEG